MVSKSLVADFGRKMDQGAAPDPLVLNGENPVFRSDRSLQRHWTGQHEALLAVQNPPPGNLSARFVVPETRPTQRDALTRDGERGAALVNIGKLVLVERI